MRHLLGMLLVPTLCLAAETPGDFAFGVMQGARSMGRATPIRCRTNADPSVGERNCFTSEKESERQTSVCAFYKIGSRKYRGQTNGRAQCPETIRTDAWHARCATPLSPSGPTPRSRKTQMQPMMSAGVPPPATRSMKVRRQSAQPFSCNLSEFSV
jgi:hypothetical protein